MTLSRYLSDYLARDELVALNRRSNIRAWWAFAVNWGLIAAAFALVVHWPNPLTVVVAVLVIAGRQLGLGILVHDCAHQALFRGVRANMQIGQALAGWPMNISVAAYRTYHLAHHRHAGTAADPDLGFVAAYPVTAASLRRKLWRDVSGQTGLRDLRSMLARFRLAQEWPWLAFHAGLLAVLVLAGAWWAYGLWWVAYLFVYPVIMRLRQIGEHGVVSNRGHPDPRMNTATTHVSWWERLLIAPNHVNWHLEHHVAGGVPPYRLARMHQLLHARGFYDGHDALSRGYADVVRRATRV
ncbi:fatty acid desaturase family protein [Novosphingobium sp.]|uniref:fatty acid desaturase family protein n=1 Tax=Novosphingobium sp. TaxID=1874826 RepID=UPI00333F5D5A